MNGKYNTNAWWLSYITKFIYPENPTESRKLAYQFDMDNEITKGKKNNCHQMWVNDFRWIKYTSTLDVTTEKYKKKQVFFSFSFSDINFNW